MFIQVRSLYKKQDFVSKMTSTQVHIGMNYQSSGVII